MKECKILIVGAGKLGEALSRKLCDMCVLHAIIDRSGKYIPDSPGFVYKFDKIEKAKTLFADLDGNYVLFAVSDSSVAECALEFGAIFGDHVKNFTAIHFSGLMRRDVLAELEKKGTKTAACHPFQTFYSYTPELFNEVAWGIETDNLSRENAVVFINLLSGKPYELTAKALANKAAYHAAGAAVSNYLTSAFALAKSIAKSIDLPDYAFFPKIAETTILNSLEALDGDYPLTGPIARSDSSAIVAHLNALKNEPRLFAAYKSAALSALEIAFSYDKISEYNYLIMKTAIEESKCK